MVLFNAFLFLGEKWLGIVQITFICVWKHGWGDINFNAGMGQKCHSVDEGQKLETGTFIFGHC